MVPFPSLKKTKRYFKLCNCLLSCVFVEKNEIRAKEEDKKSEIESMPAPMCDRIKPAKQKTGKTASWKCKSCTYSNKQSKRIYCEMCGTKRGSTFAEQQANNVKIPKNVRKCRAGVRKHSRHPFFGAVEVKWKPSSNRVKFNQFINSILPF